MSSNATGIEMVAGGQLPELWVPALVVGNAFAFFFLVRLFFLTHPGLLQRLAKQLCCCVPTRGISAAQQGRDNATTSAGIKHSSSAPKQACATVGPNLGNALDLSCQTAPQGGTPTSSQGGAVDDGPPAMAAPTHGQHQELAPNPDASVIRRASSMINLVTLQWAGLGCSYRSASGVKVVLQGVWGEVRHGEMHALLGPSGAGKSTLMDMLTQRKQVGDLSGQLLLNGRPAGPRALVHRSAYVPQEDNFVPVMTAGETLRFFADMRLPPRLSSKAREARATEVLAMVGLAHCYNTMVGGQLPGGLTLRGLSGGERKRLSLAVGILAAPSILFLDEPTSGLDSFAALTVMRYLSSMAKEAGHIIIASIHQPRSAIWAMFDSVTVLSRGMLLYTGRRDDMVPWFTQQLPALMQPGSDALAACSPPPTHSHTSSSMGPTDAPASATDLMAVVLSETSAMNGADNGNRAGPLVPAARQQQQQGCVGGMGVGSGAEVPGAVSAGAGAMDKARARKWQFFYSPDLHGVASDWVMDLVSVGFAKPAEYFGSTLSSLSDLRQASHAFTTRYLADKKARPSPSVPLPQLPAAFVNSSTPSRQAGHVAVAVGPGRGVRAGGAQALPTQQQPWRAQGVGPGSEGGQEGDGGAAEQQQEDQLRDQFEQVYGDPTTSSSCQAGLPSPGGPDIEDGAGPGGRRLAAPSSPRSPLAGLAAAPAGSGGSSSPASPALDISKLNKVVEQAGKRQAAARRQAAALSGFTRQDLSPSLPLTLAGPGLSAPIARAHSSHSAPQPGSHLGHTQAARGQVGGLGVEQSRLLGARGGGQGCWRLRAGLPAPLLRLGLHLRALLGRELTTVTRNPADVAGRMLTFAWIAFFIGLIFYNLPATPEAVQLRLNLHYSNTSFFLLMPYISMSLYTSDRQYYLADISSSLYRPIIYYIAKASQL
ncbi:hypothetical protein V8C86DRAFT_3086957 [Haematococcus lacustris]